RLPLHRHRPALPAHSAGPAPAAVPPVRLLALWHRRKSANCPVPQRPLHYAAAWGATPPGATSPPSGVVARLLALAGATRSRGSPPRLRPSTPVVGYPNVVFLPAWHNTTTPGSQGRDRNGRTPR